MASDLTTLLKERFTATVEASLSSIIDINKVTKIDTSFLTSQQLILVDSKFIFNEQNILIRYIVDLPLISLVFHSMMFEEYKLEENIDNDMLDAVKELIAQVSGGLETAINTANFADINGVKFSIENAHIHTEESYTSLGNLVKFDLTINTKPFKLFLDFDNNSFTYFNELSNANISDEKVQPSIKEDIKVNEDDFDIVPDELVVHDEEKRDIDVVINEDTKVNQVSENEVSEIENNKEEPKETSQDESNNEEKKNKKLKLIAIILGGVIGLLIVVIVILYFTGVFDEEELQETNTTTIIKPSEQDLIIADIKNKQINFTPELIDEKRVNTKLALLTKYEILEEDVVKIFQEKEKERLYKLKMEKLEEFAQNNKEESLFKATLLKEQNTTKLSRFDENSSKQFDNNITSESQLLNEILTFIKVNPIEYKNFKTIIGKEKTKTTSISMCKDKNQKINIYIGPMYINLETNNIIKAVKQQYKNSKEDISLIQMSRKEFNEMCNF